MLAKRLRILVVALAACTAAPLVAQSGDETPETSDPTPALRDSITVTANRLVTRVDEVGSSVTVLRTEEIELLGKTTVAELLRTVPGLEVVRGGGPGQVTSVFIRGGSSSHTLVLLDGMRLNAPATGAFDFANLATDAIERIEIVRGPQSTLYGSEAMAGVISITSKTGTEGFHVAGAAEAGELGHRRWQLQLDGGGDRFDYLVAASGEQIEGVSAASERAGARNRQRPLEGDPFENTSATARLGFAFAGDGRVDFNLRAFDGEVRNDGFDFFAGPVDDRNRLQERRGLTASLELRKKLGRRLDQTLRVGWNEEDLSGSDPDDFFSNFAVDGRRLELASQLDVAVNDSNTLTFGLSYEDRGADSAGNFDQSVDILSVFVHNAWSVEDRLHLTAGARYDDHSEFGGETTYRLGMSGRLGPATRLHGTFGTGFKAPTLNDLFFPFFSNPGLLPEASEGFDLGVEQTWFDDRLSLDLTWFETDFEDLIAFDFVTFAPQNVARATSSGFEASVRYRPGPGFQLTASHTRTDTEDEATGQQLARRPKNRSTLSLYFKPSPRLRAAVTLFAVSDRIDSDGSAMDDYERVDLALRFKAGEAFEPYLRVENLLDEEFEEINGFTSPGALAVAGLRFRR